LHLSPQAEAALVDVYLDGSETPALEDVLFETGVQVQLPTATTSIDVAPADMTLADSVLNVTDPMFAEGESYSVTAWGLLDPDQISGTFWLDDLAVPPGQTRVSAGIATLALMDPEADLLDLVNKVNLGSMAPGAAALHVDYDPTGLELGIDVDEDGISEMDFSIPELAPDAQYNFWLYDDNMGNYTMMSQAVDGSTQAYPANVCGNDVVEGILQICDGADLAGQDCVGLGFVDGELGCLLDCSDFDISACNTCGNNTIDGPDVCDGADLGGETCETQGFAGGELGCAMDCSEFDTSACIQADYEEDWEDANPPSLNSEWVLGGDADWFTTDVNPLDDLLTAQSGDIDDSQTSSLDIVLNFDGGGDVQFNYRVSSEGGWDYLRFFIDDVEQDIWSGIEEGASAVYPLAAGQHTLSWRYTKDGSVTANDDTAWIDNIVTTGGTLP